MGSEAEPKNLSKQNITGQQRGGTDRPQGIITGDFIAGSHNCTPFNELPHQNNIIIY